MIDAKKSVRFANMMKNFNTKQMAEFYQVLVNDGDLESFFESVQKHGSHNQETHGNWAKGGEGKKVTGLINKLYEKKTPGFSINIKSRTTPKTGFMCSEKGFEKTIPVEDFYKSRDVARKYLVDYMKQNSDALSRRGAYFGAWVDGGKVYLDVSRRYDTRQAGVDAGVSNEQQAIYDVKNDSFIYVGGNDGEANKAVADGSSETSQSDDGAGIGSVRRRDFERDGEVEDDDFNPLESETLTAHTSNGRTLGIRPGEFVTKKHQQHDQSTHGNWASFGSDSSSLARNGAKQYAKQIGLDPDTSIDYKTVVANQARASKIADEYDKLPDFDREAVDEFQTLAREVNSQFDFMTKKLNVKVQFVKNDPYKTSKEMFKDVDKGVLKVLSTESTGGHPVFSNEQNDKFRAVHDFFGHAATGRGFGQDGEEAAWVHHSQMFTPKARLALTTETRGQNSWYNTRKNGFAKQKVALLPEEFVLVPETFEKHGTHDQSSHAGSRRRIGGDTETAQPKKPQGEQEVTDPNAPKPKLKPGRKPDASGTLEQRAEKLARGERVQVSKSEAKQIMEIMSKRSDDPDLTNLHVQDTELYDEDNLGIPRNKMPQVPSDTKGIFITEMEKRGARVQRGVADPSKLHPIQAEMSASKVGLIMKTLREKGTRTDDGGRIIISKDNYVIDGHHRWAAASMLSFENSDIKLPVIRVDLNHRDLIDATLAWNEATGIKPIGMGESNKPGQIRKAWAEFDSILAKAVRAKTVIRFQPGLKPIIKHQQHDQSSHGNWAGGETNYPSQKTSFTYNGDGSYTYKYGDLEFTDDTLLSENVREAYGNWIQMGGNFQMRIISAAVMGLNKPKASGEQELSDWTTEVLETGKKIEGNSLKDIADFQQTLVDTNTLMVEAHYGRSDVPMYRGIFIPKSENGFDNLQKGERFKMPLTAFTNNKEYIKTFDKGQDFEKGVTFTLMPNARGFDNQKDARVDNFHEFVTQGEYEVILVDKKTPTTNIVLRQISSFNPRTGRYEN